MQGLSTLNMDMGIDHEQASVSLVRIFSVSFLSDNIHGLIQIAVGQARNWNVSVLENIGTFLVYQYCPEIGSGSISQYWNAKMVSTAQEACSQDQFW